MRAATIGSGRMTVAHPDNKRRVLWAACVAHALHDGYTDLVYVMLPVWQTQFGIGYAGVAAIRTMYVGTSACLQVPSNRLAERLGSRATLVLGTVLAAAGYGLAGLSGSLLGLGIALAVAGCGSSTQHPTASGAVSRAYGADARGPLGIYNFAGDLGKAVLPSGVSVLLTVVAWHVALWIIAVVGLLVAAAVVVLMPKTAALSGAIKHPEGRLGPARGGFLLLLTIGVLDSAARMGLLTFLPFLLKAKGAPLPLVGTALALVFIGGAAGKFTCGWLGARVGVLWTVLLTEGATAAAILSVLVLPLIPMLILLPFLGVMLNGTSSVLYGTVPEVSPTDRTERAFAIFYTGTLGSGAIFPILYGTLADATTPQWAVAATAATATFILPLAAKLAPKLRNVSGT
jgi:MFS transporter, FSR family, fosmidomycin resistance protein